MVGIQKNQWGNLILLVMENDDRILIFISTYLILTMICSKKQVPGGLGKGRLKTLYYEIGVLQKLDFLHK